MATKKNFGKFCLYSIIVCLMFYGIIELISNGSGNFLKLELIGFFGLLLLSVIGFLSYKSKCCGENLLFFMFSLSLINLVLIWYVNGTLFTSLLFLTLIGFLMSFPKKKKCVARKNPCADLCTDCNPKITEPKIHSVGSAVKKTEFVEPAFEKENKETLQKPKLAEELHKTKPKTTKTNPTTKTVQFIPGKYVASKRSNVYHEPKCDWAKKIKKDRQIWFNSEEEAQKKGYKRHTCVVA